MVSYRRLSPVFPENEKLDSKAGIEDSSSTLGPRTLQAVLCVTLGDIYIYIYIIIPFIAKNDAKVTPGFRDDCWLFPLFSYHFSWRTQKSSVGLTLAL